MLPYVDTHAHLPSVPTAIEPLFAAGFGGIIDIGTKCDDLSARIAAFSAYPRVAFSAGIWPSADAIRARADELRILRAAIEAQRSRVVAVGECGVDRYWNQPENGADDAGELELFAEQALMALELGVPVIVHSRDAAAETAAVLEPLAARGLRILIHCFSYGADEARRFLDLGCFLSFAGNLTYRNAEAIRDAARITPIDRILLETDAPYLAPVPFRGKKAAPSMVSQTYAVAAEIKGIAEKALVEAVTDNVDRLFGPIFTRS